MPYRGDAFAAGEYYHIYNRGAGRQSIFFSDANYRYLLRLIAEDGRRYHATVIAYCLMPNHYHFLIRQDGAQPLSKFINVLFSAYVQDINREQGRIGTLFQGRFRHRCVSDWSYLLMLCRYIHMNPVRARLVSQPEQWPYSDFSEWIGLRASGFGDLSFTRLHFPDPEEYRSFVLEAQAVAGDPQRLQQYVWD